MSQDSQCSSIPSELTDYQDEDFINELQMVDVLYFGAPDESPNYDSDDDIDSENATVNYESDASSGADEYESVINIEPSEVDTIEYIKQAQFRNETCGCKEFYGQPCSKTIDFDSLVEYRESCKELSREELDIVVKSQLFAHRRSGTHTVAKKKTQSQRKRTAFSGILFPWKTCM